MTLKNDIIDDLIEVKDKVSWQEDFLGRILRKSEDMQVPIGRDLMMIRFGMIFQAIRQLKNISVIRMILPLSIWLTEQTDEKLKSLFEQNHGIISTIFPKDETVR